MESFATPYPLFYSDGDQEVDKGQIGIHSVLQFKRFQAQLSRLIGTPANQLSAVFVCRRSSEKRQKLPINENTNFNIILNQHNPSKEKDCYFLVSLKKSKKERKGSRRRTAEADSVDDDDSTSSRGDSSPAAQRPGKDSEDFEATSPNSVLDQQPGLSEAAAPVTTLVNPVTNPVRLEVNHEKTSVSPPVTRIGGQLLSRGAAEQAKFGVIGSGKAAEVVTAGLTGQNRFKDTVQIQQQQQQQQRGMSRSGAVYPDGMINMRLLTGRIPQQVYPQPGAVNHSHLHFPDVHQKHQQQRLSIQARLARPMLGTSVDHSQYCPDCASYQERNIRPPPFHCCINDRITIGFNGPSPAGPIERPVKRQVKAAA